MEKTLIASIVAIAFIIITSILFIARKKYSSLDIPAIVSAIASVVAVIVAILAMPDSTRPPTAVPISSTVELATEKPTDERIPQPSDPTSTHTPTLTPTNIPMPTNTPSPTPTGDQSGWIIYDDFDDPGKLDTNWLQDDESQLCQLSVVEGQLHFDCLNESTDDRGAALSAAHHSPDTAGVAATVSVEKTGGPFQLVTSWVCAAQEARKDYHLELDVDAVRATEFYPQEGWRDVLLGERAVAAGQAHLLQMERTGDSITFSIDGQPLALDVVPDLPDCYVMNYWSFDFWVWQDGNRLAGQVDQALVKTESSQTTCDAHAHFQRGWDLINEGTQNCDAALKEMSQAITCNPDDADMWYGRGNVDFQCGLYTEAVADLSEAIGRNDRNSLYYELRALACMRLGDRDGLECCVQDFVRVLALSPNNATALNDKPECQRALCPFFDDFETGAVDPSRWAGDEGYDDYVSVKDGHLTFETPLNAGAEGIDPKLADAQLADWSVSRIMFTFKLDVPAGTDTGFLFFATSCKPDYDQVWIKALNEEDKPWAALLRDRTVVDTIVFEPVTRNEAHTLELRWQTDHIQVYIDGQLQDGTIPCQEPGGYAHFGVDLPPKTRFVGYLDDICIWP